MTIELVLSGGPMPKVIPVINETQSFEVRSELDKGQKKIAARNGQLEEPKQENYGIAPGAKMEVHLLTGNAPQFNGEHKKASSDPTHLDKAQQEFANRFTPAPGLNPEPEQQLVNSTAPTFTPR